MQAIQTPPEKILPDIPHQLGDENQAVVLEEQAAKWHGGMTSRKWADLVFLRVLHHQP